MDEYNDALSKEDGDSENKKIIEQHIATQQARKKNYENMQQQLEQSDEVQISTCDPDARQLITRNNITEVAYNIQTVFDAEHKIPIDHLVTNTNDSKAMGEMLERTNEIIPIKNKTILYDKGYHTGSEIKKAFDMDVNIMVAIPAVSSHAPDTNYDIEHFIYDKENDLYRCPQNQTLHTNGKEYTKHHSKKNSVQVIHYKTAACLTRPAFAKCTTNKKSSH
ncbi:MAG: transposase [Chitinophagaceae bacterium]